jgi:hypothetical protein
MANKNTELNIDRTVNRSLAAMFVFGVICSLYSYYETHTLFLIILHCYHGYCYIDSLNGF